MIGRAGLGQTRQTGLVANDHRVDWCDAYRLFSGDVAYVWHGGTHAAEVASNLETAGFRIRTQIIWAKQHFALGRGDYHWQHEPLWHAVREGCASRWNGDRKQSTLWTVANLNPFGGSTDEVPTGHGTQKPIELMRRPILNNTRLGEIVYDPFLGSGTILIAAQTTERICYGIEIDPAYVDVIVKRWQVLTKQRATLDDDGRTFDDVAEERQLLSGLSNMARPKFEPTAEQRQQVKSLVALGILHDDIATFIGKSKEQVHRSRNPSRVPPSIIFGRHSLGERWRSAAIASSLARRTDRHI